ncbi:septum site-determining protein MinC [cyanobiont of Ornithocercus magnificus]|nr:septum site-determining protein MinC [cyanobiont of Ornithocercus magnificus]
MDSKQIQVLLRELSERNLDPVSLQSCSSVTVISAAAHGIPARLNCCRTIDGSETAGETNLQVPILFHQGTLHAGDQLSARGDILILGDVNPGASVHAGGNVMVWGRLRGVAHAGRYGDTSARIVALQLHPLQLRIGNSIACGPDELPQPGVVEEAILKEGVIQIEVARMGASRH